MARNHEITAMASTCPIILCLSGFGDRAGLSDPMLSADLAQVDDLRPLNMPGFGAARKVGETGVLR